MSYGDLNAALTLLSIPVSGVIALLIWWLILRRRD